MEWLVEDSPKKNIEQCLDYLKFWVNSIIVHTSNTVAGSNTVRTAPIAFVGTRKDIVSGDFQHKAISSLIYDTFRSSIAWPNVIEYQNMSCNGKDSYDLCFFPIDNTLSGLDPVANTLQAEIEKVIDQSEYVHKEQPLTWLRVLDTFSALDSNSLTFNEVMRISAQCNVPEDEVKDMLLFFHQMGMLMFCK